MHAVSLLALKSLAKENVALHTQGVKTREQLMNKMRQSYATRVVLAVVLGERETHDALDGVGVDTLAGLERELIGPLREHLAVCSALQHKADAVHTLQVEDRHRERLATMSRKHTKTEAFQQTRARFNSEKEQSIGLCCETIAETATLELERETVTCPTMSTIHVAFSQHLDAVTRSWACPRGAPDAAARHCSIPASPHSPRVTPSLPC